RLVLDLPSTSLVAAQQYILTEINDTTSSAILIKTAATLPGVNEAILAKEVSAEAVSGTDMFEIVVTDTNPARGAQIANAVAQQLVLDGYNNIARMNAAAQAMMQINVDNALHDLNDAKANLQSLQDVGASPQQLLTASATLDELQTRYLNTVQGMVELQLRQALSLYGLRIITVATPDAATPQPARTLVIGLALALGLFAGVVGLLANDIFSERYRVIKDPADGIPWETLGRVWVRGAGAQAPALPEDREGFEATLQSLRFLDLAMATRHVAIIGVGRRDGASEVVAGLALASASAGQRTLLIDAAFPEGSQAQRFGVSQQPGLTEALLDAHAQGAAQPAKYLQNATSVTLPDLRLLTTGAAPVVSARVAGAPALREQVYALAQNLGAQLTLVDVTSPGRVRQMAQLAAGADAVVVVVDLRTARRADVMRTEQALTDAGAKVVGCVVAVARAATASAAPAGAGPQRGVARAVAS
ncbi:MAG TPA: hypothetical protein VF739_15150, partial [Ktedonobacterales bacterium]